MGLVPTPPGRHMGGRILFKGQDLTKLSAVEMRSLRRAISMIFQEPMTSLNPVYTVGDQIIEGIQVHDEQISPEEARKRAIDMLRKVGIPCPSSEWTSTRTKCPAGCGSA